MSDHEHFDDPQDDQRDPHGDQYDETAVLKHEDHSHDVDIKPEDADADPESPTKDINVDDEAAILAKESFMAEEASAKVEAELELIKNTVPSTALEHAFIGVLGRKDQHILRLTNEIQKLKSFISKRKQTYKRKRKDEGAPTRALSAYNIFVQDRFAQLAKENEKALKSADSEALMKRVPPANLVASTGNQWKELATEEKAKYEERAKTDRKRYDEQMAQYQPPDRAANRKRNKTGYNMFFSAHVLRLKQSETGVPSERGSVARLVGTAWKSLSQEEKAYYEREADKHNGLNPVKDDVEEEDEEEKRQHHHMADPYANMNQHDLHMHGAMPMHGHQTAQHDPRHHGYAYGAYPYTQPPYGHYDYQHHQQQHHHSRQSQGRSHGGYGHTYPPQRNPYDGM